MAGTDRTVCRFALGSPTGLRSPSFRVWTAKNYPDFYISARAVASVFKATIHAPRPELGLRQEGHAGTTANFLQKALLSGHATSTNRFAATWPGKEIAPDVWLQLQVAVPAYGLRQYDAGFAAINKPVKWIAAPAKHQMLVVSVYTVKAHAAWRSTETVLGSANLCDGRRVVIAGHYHDAPPAQELERILRAAPRRIPMPDADLRLPSMRTMLVGTGDGFGLLLDVAADMLVADGTTNSRP
jgi:hypothetical protein